jgi:ABC-type nitrate/sulfonate/bicarbonate transport system substrate-binding protein
MFKLSRRSVLAGSAGVAAFALGARTNGSRAAMDKIRVAWGDVIDAESLPMAIALARVKDRGFDNEITSFAQEDLAIQATVGGQADIGIATPFAVMQKVKDLRIFFQDEALIFYAVVANEFQTWKDLDGQPFVFHARGSGTEAYGNFMAKQNDISFGQISYLSGSGNRSVAMLGGQINATILDLANTNKVLKEAPDKFHLLPGPKQAVTNEGIFAHQDWMKDNPEAVAAITEEFLKLYREMRDNPGIIAAEREKRGLLADQPKDTAETITAFVKQGMESGLWNPEGGSEALAQADVDFYSISGAIQTPADQLNPADFWDLAPLEAAKKKLGG